MACGHFRVDPYVPGKSKERKKERRKKTIDFVTLSPDIIIHFVRFVS